MLYTMRNEERASRTKGTGRLASREIIWVLMGVRGAILEPRIRSFGMIPGSTHSQFAFPLYGPLDLLDEHHHRCRYPSPPMKCYWNARWNPSQRYEGRGHLDQEQ